MAEAPESPRLRAVDAFAVTVDGRDLVALRDPSGLTDAVLTLPRAAAPVLALFDGSHSLLDVQAEVMRMTGELILRSQLEALVETLDHHLFLDSPRLAAERARIAREFLAGATRPPFHAGRAYQPEAPELALALDAHFVHPEGPGPAGPSGDRRVHGLVAPHIDFTRGGPTYAWGYKTLAEAAPIDCAIIFGTAHAGLDGQPFAATAKAYATPFGPLAVDHEVLDSLVRRAPGDLFAAELAHRGEHSIEFQAVYLQYLRHRRGEDDRPLTIVPILASFVHECLVRGRDPATAPEVMGVLDALRDVIATVPRRYCVVGGADLAHMGPRFGDPAPVSARDRARIEAEDRRLLARVESRDPDGFYAEVVRDGDRRRTCGLSPIYALLRALPGGRGRLVRYGQWPEPEGTVTYASVSFADDPDDA